MRRCVALLLVIASATLAAKVPLGPEAAVNDPTAGQQGVASFGGRPVSPVAIANRPDGSYVVAWNETDPGGIYARLFGSNGAPLGDQFKVANGARTLVDAGVAVDGSFVLVWNGLFGEGAIEARRYTAAGTPAGDAFIVSSGQPNCSSSAFRWPQVTVAADGSFAVVWTCDIGLVFARRYDADGLAIGPAVDLNAQAQIVSSRTDAFIDNGGLLWVFHESSCRIAPESNTFSTPCATRFNSFGTRVGDPVPLGPQGAFGTLERASGLQVARDVDGNFALSWIRGETGGFAMARSYSADGSPRGAEFPFPASDVLTGTPRVDLSDDGSFVVTYPRRVTGDANRSEVVAREFGLDMSSPGPTFRAHADTTFSNEHGVVAVGPDNDYVIAFSSLREGGNFDVYARRFGEAPPADVDLAVEIDGFPRTAAPGSEILFEVNVSKLTEGDAARDVAVVVTTDGPPLRVEGIDDERNFDCVQILGGGLRCVLGEQTASTENFIARQDAPSISLTPPEPVFVTTTATVSATNPDPNEANNTDNDRIRIGTPGSVRFVVVGEPLFSALENAGTITVQVERVGGNVGAAGVDVQLLDVGELGTGDITFPANARLTWADGESGARTLLVPIVQDTLDENDELKDIQLANPSGVTIQGPPGARIEVRDEDDPPRASVTPVSQNTPEGGSATFAIALSGASGKPINVGLAYSGTALLGTDYTATPGSGLVSFAPGETQKQVDVAITDDAAEEGDESILADLDFSNALNVTAGAQTRHTVTIPANDSPNPADVSALIQGSTDPLVVNQRRVFTLTAVNFGPSAAAAVNSQLNVQGGRIVGFPQPPAGPFPCTRSNFDRTLDCALGAIPANQERTYTVEIEAPAEPGELQLRHDVLTGQPDPNLANNDAQRTVEVRAAAPGAVRFVYPATYPERIPENGSVIYSVYVARSGGEGPASVAFRVIPTGNDAATEATEFAIERTGRLFFQDSDAIAFIEIELFDDTRPEALESITLELLDPQGVGIDPGGANFTLLLEDDDGGTGDTDPAPFILGVDGQPQQVVVQPGAEVITGPVTVSGIGGPAPISVGGGPGKALGPVGYSINGGPFTSDDGVVNNGDRVRLRIVAPGAPGSSLTGTLTIGGRSASFTVVTPAADAPAAGGGDGGGAMGGLLLLVLAGFARRAGATRLWRFRIHPRQAGCTRPTPRPTAATAR